MKTLFVTLAIFVMAVAPYNLKSQSNDHVLVEWLFEPPTNPGTLNPNYVDIAHMSADPMVSHGIFPTGNGFTSGVSGSSSDRAVIRRDWPTDTTDYGDYLGFEININPNVVCGVDSFSLWFYVSAFGPDIFKIRSSKNSFTTPLDVRVTTQAQTWYKWTIPLDAFFVADQPGNPQPDLTFRFYSYGGVSGGSTTVAVDSVRIYGVPLVQNSMSIKALLSGPFDGVSMMKDSLRTHGLIPLHDPYGSTDSTSLSVLAVTGANAIVDWVRLEFRDPINPSLVVTTKSALLQRDGDVVSMDGYSSPIVTAAPGLYYVVLSHRNHLGVMTANPVNITNLIDFTSVTTPTWGLNAEKQEGGKMTLWPGNVKTSSIGDGVQYTGMGNDRDPILIVVGSTTPNAVATGYLATDTNMDGEVKYTGSGNDRDLILQSVGGTTPNNILMEQVP